MTAKFRCEDCKNFNKPAWGAPCDECKFLEGAGGIENFFEPAALPLIEVTEVKEPPDSDVTCNDCIFAFTHEDNEPCSSCKDMRNFQLMGFTAPVAEDVNVFTKTEPAKTEPVNSALDVQVGGGHYKNLVIQPIEYTFKNNLNFLQGNIVKYITRYKDKNGKEDLEKVIHYAQLLIELEYGNE